jgi:ATP-dependent RNA helicase RhlE
MSNSQIKNPQGFGGFALPKPLLDGVKAAGFTAPRPIQAETIPAGIEGRDVLGLAQTGTGKTAAFALPLLHWILKDNTRGPSALVLAPTRELASQIAEEIKVLAKFTPLKLVTIYGGVPAFQQIQRLRKDPDIVVGCPGRVLDLIQQGRLDLSRAETLVLDEADHMFDMGFLPDIRKIMAVLPSHRQNLLFSATMPREIRGLANEILHDPHVVELASSSPAATIEHTLLPVAERQKRDLLEHVLKNDNCNSAIVFTRTKHRTRRLADQLVKAGHRAVGLQGNMSQAQRDRAMKGFRSRRFDILVATDIAARGIDVSNVSHVINFDVPNTPEAYTHRIGRTGRSECTGVARTFVTGEDHGWIRAVERMIGAPILRQQVEGFEAIGEEPPLRPRQPRNGGQRQGAPRQGGQQGQQGPQGARPRRRRRKRTG